MSMAAYRVAEVQYQTDSKRLTRSHRNWIYVAILIGIWSFSVALHVHQGGGVADAAAKPSKYMVQSGESVWSIAEKFGRQRDPRVIVDEIEQLNHLNGYDTIQPGQVLVIPGN